MLSTQSAGEGALVGIRVVDLTRVLAGPLCTQTLADHGAEVIKVEPPAGDDTRQLGPPFDESGMAAYYASLNRGKLGIGLNLSKPAGREVLFRLLEEADVLIENFVPGTMERWGLGFESVLSQRFPKLIYCTVTGFGPDGPLGGLPGYDAVLQATCGLMSVNGDTVSGPTRVGVPIVDHVTGYIALSGILMALLARARTGKGQRVEATLFDTALSLLLPHASNWMYSGRTPGLLGSAHPNIAAYDRFRCADGDIFLGVISDTQFRIFCEHVGLQALLTDPRFVTNALRVEHRSELRAAIERALAGLERETLCEALMGLGVPAGSVNSVPEAFAQPHTRHRAMLVERPGYRGTGLPIKLKSTPGQPGGAPPRFGQHTDEVLARFGFDQAAVARLRAEGVLPGEHS